MQTLNELLLEIVKAQKTDNPEMFVRKIVEALWARGWLIVPPENHPQWK